MSENPLEYQVGGDHYRRLGIYQPWLVLKNWCTIGNPTGMEAYLASEIVVYMCRFITDAPGKGGIDDVRKAAHSIEYLLTLLKDKCAKAEPDPLERAIYRAYSGAPGQKVFVQYKQQDGQVFVRPENGKSGFLTSENKISRE